MVFVGRICDRNLKSWQRIFLRIKWRLTLPILRWTQKERSHWQKGKKIGPFSWTSWTAKTKEHCPGSDISSWLKNSSSPTQPFKLIICRFFSVCFQMPSTLQAPLVPSKKAYQPEASHCYWAMVFNPYPSLPCLKNVAQWFDCLLKSICLPFPLPRIDHKHGAKLCVNHLSPSVVSGAAA